MRARHIFAAFSLLAVSAAPAFAGPCPAVMIVLDRSGSMDEQPDSGSGTGPSKLEIAKTAIGAVVDKYGDVLPLGLETFQSDFSGSNGCFGGIDVVVEPSHGSGAALKSKIPMIMSGGGTNTGQAINKAVADPAMKDPKRPGSYILLITDGEPNCDGTTQKDPLYTVSEIKKAHDAGVDTFVIGFGQLPAEAQTNMALMASAGGHECMGATCNGQKYYAADSAQSLNDALDAITLQITGEFAGKCDDSCYTNGCDAGLLCVKGTCQPDPCVNVTTCAPGDYCFTDGTSPGTCVSACSQSCPSGQSCQFGKCSLDPCATTSCGDGQVCKNGNCVANKCGASGCATGLICQAGACIDDPCHYITCPASTTCVQGVGSCASSTEVVGAGATAGGTDATRHVGGCAFGQIDPGAPSLMVILLGGALAIVSRRRPPRP